MWELLHSYCTAPTSISVPATELCLISSWPLPCPNYWNLHLLNSALICHLLNSVTTTTVLYIMPIIELCTAVLFIGYNSSELCNHIFFPFHCDQWDIHYAFHWLNHFWTLIYLHLSSTLCHLLAMFHSNYECHLLTDTFFLSLIWP